MSLPSPKYAPCTKCGEVLELHEGKPKKKHKCKKERRLDHQIVQLRPDIRRFEGDFRKWEGTKEGRFATYCAVRQRQQG